MALHSLGRAAESDAALTKMIDDGAAAGYQIAEACAWRGEVDRAFEWLENAYAARDPGLGHSATDRGRVKTHCAGTPCKIDLSERAVFNYFRVRKGKRTPETEIASRFYTASILC